MSLIPHRGPPTPPSLFETKELVREEGKGGQLGLAQPGEWQQIFMEAFGARHSAGRGEIRGCGGWGLGLGG